jgi:riboflavin-specific deaminase-like protein
MSVDGCIDDTTGQRLILSNEADFDEVDQIRAESDAIMIGATTLRRDNPRLLVKSDARRAVRVARGEPEYPLKVTLTASGDLSPDLKFWHYGGDKLVYVPHSAAEAVYASVGHLTAVADTGDRLDMAAILDDLGERGIRRLMVEGGGSVHTQFLSAGLADEIRCAVAPFFLGDPQAPKFVNPATFANGPDRRMVLDQVRQVGDIAVLRYLPKEASQAAA